MGIEGRSNPANLVISGVYHANEHFKDVSVDVFNQRLADKIGEQRSNAILVTLDNKRLSSILTDHALIVQQFDADAGRWKSLNPMSDVLLEHGVESLNAVSALIQRKYFRDLLDFDNHLDDLTKDYLNVDLNMEIDGFIA